MRAERIFKCPQFPKHGDTGKRGDYPHIVALYFGVVAGSQAIEHKPDDRDASASKRFEREQRVIYRPQPVRDNDDCGEPESGREVREQKAVGKRHKYASRAFNDYRFVLFREREERLLDYLRLD